MADFIPSTPWAYCQPVRFPATCCRSDRAGVVTGSSVFSNAVMEQFAIRFLPLHFILGFRGSSIILQPLKL
jgi:hypothetical protein